MIFDIPERQEHGQYQHYIDVPEGVIPTPLIYVKMESFFFKVSKGAKRRNRYNQVPHLIQDINGKVTNSQLDTSNESHEVSPFPAGDHKSPNFKTNILIQQKIILYLYIQKPINVAEIIKQIIKRYKQIPNI